MKKLLSAALVLITVISLSSCALFGLTHIEDENGEEDFSIATISDERICKKNCSYSSLGAVTSKKDNKVTSKIRKLSGVYCLDTFSFDEGVLMLHTNIKVISGNLRAVIYSDGEILSDITINEEFSCRLEETDKKYEVRLIAESAKLEAEISYEIIDE